MIETYGKEYYQVRNTRGYIWTFIDGGGRNTLLLSGWYIVNRIGDFVDEGLEVNPCFKIELL